MVRKQTWILLGVLAVLLGLAYYLQQNPVAGSVSATPSPTPTANMLEGWTSNDIVWIEFKNFDGYIVDLTKEDQTGWMLGPEGDEMVEPGNVEQIRAQIVDIRTLALLDPGYNLESVGLAAPSNILTVKDAQGRKAIILFGNQTPTESGYYVQVNGEAPKVVSKYAVESLFDLFNKEQFVTVPAVSEEDKTADPAASP
jgi:hypothetical protein